MHEVLKSLQDGQADIKATLENHSRRFDRVEKSLRLLADGIISVRQEVKGLSATELQGLYDEMKRQEHSAE